jgi:tetratricopeptide (TPR) repeat protein
MRPGSAALVSQALDAALAVGNRSAALSGKGNVLRTAEARSWFGWPAASNRLVVASVVLVAIVVSVSYLAARSATTAPRPRVALEPFRNMTGETALDYIEYAVSESMATALASVPTVEVIPVGQREGARRYTLTGSFHRRGDSLEFAIEIMDNVRNRALPAPAPVRTAADNPLYAADVIRHRAMGALAYYTSVFGVDSAPERRPPAYAAYLAFAEGLAARLRFDWTASELALRRAIALDPSYTEAYFLLAATFANQRGRANERGGLVGRYEAIDSLAKEARRAIAPMTAADRSVLSFLVSYAAGDLNGALDATVRLGERMPAANFNVGFMGVLANRPQVAIKGLERLDPDEGWTREWSPYWVQLTAALHQAGNYKQELRAAQRGQQRYSQSMLMLHAEQRARIGLGELDGLSRQDMGPLTILQLALELRAHGHLSRSGEWMRSIVDGAPAGEILFPLRIWVSMALLALDRVEDATAMIERSVQLDTLAIDQRGLLGTAYARQGKRAAAMRISDELAQIKEPFLQGLPTLWRAKIAARLGDRDTAVELLAQAFAEGVMYHPAYPSQRGSFWHTDPDFELLRGYRRYEDLIRPR